MLNEQPTALVLGAGLQGICAALALNSRGYNVTLIDQADGCMARTSGRNEAKIHLGFVYAHDESFRTSSLMLDASLAFAPLLESWLGGPLDWQSIRSTPFLYAVMPDSLLSFEELGEFYDRVQSAYLERLGARNYLGLQPRTIWRPVKPAGYPSWFDRSAISGLFETEEAAVDLDKLRNRLAAGVEEAERIHTRYGSRVENVERTPTGFRASGLTASGDAWEERADIVVNCLWGGRLTLDQAMGLRPERPWVYRLKYRVLGELPKQLAGLPSLTFVLGRYGDIATYGGATSYLSWYPACLQGWSDELAPPAAWADACAGRPDPATAERVASETLAALDRIVPGIAASTVTHVDAGVIFSWGRPHVDVDDPDSELHERYAVGVHAQDGYFSIDTGKFTCAPLFASQLLDALE